MKENVYTKEIGLKNYYKDIYSDYGKNCRLLKMDIPNLYEKLSNFEDF